MLGTPPQLFVEQLLQVAGLPPELQNCVPIAQVRGFWPVPQGAADEVDMREVDMRAKSKITRKSDTVTRCFFLFLIFGENTKKKTSNCFLCLYFQLHLYTCKHFLYRFCITNLNTF